jgi:hypothetical protein
METILEESNIKIERSQNDHFLSITIDGDIDFSAYRFAYDHLLNFAVREQIHKILIDHTELGKTSLRTKSWYAAVFVPQLFSKLGFNLQIAVMVKPTKYVDSKTKIFISQFKNISKKVKIAPFEYKEEAYQWFQSLKLNGNTDEKQLE